MGARLGHGKGELGCEAGGKRAGISRGIVRTESLGTTRDRVKREGKGGGGPSLLPLPPSTWAAEGSEPAGNRGVSFLLDRFRLLVVLPFHTRLPCQATAITKSFVTPSSSPSEWVGMNRKRPRSERESSKVRFDKGKEKDCSPNHWRQFSASGTGK